jgi:small-conductance mechanosensitive channel
MEESPPMTTTDDEIARFKREVERFSPDFKIDGVSRGFLLRIIADRDSSRRTIAERTKERDAALGTADDVYARWSESQSDLAKALEEIERLTQERDEFMEQAALKSSCHDDMQQIMATNNDLLARLASARSDALADAAKVANGYAEHNREYVAAVCRHIATAIRALKEEGRPK